jgi:peptidoglycan L-alanyl-D-glutamate endopeptidase CwlK
MINSRNIEDLHPIVKIKCQKFLDLCSIAFKDTNIKVILTSTYRDNESQAKLYAQGRTEKGNIVTNAKAGKSYHNYKMAFDFLPTKDGKASWDDIKLWQKCGLLAKEAGLEWGGDWVYKDMPHAQYTGGLSISQLQNGLRI